EWTLIGIQIQQIRYSPEAELVRT
ncbi:hypothetical protein MIMGU_mgv11b0209581mg, partial [Erythranthe guttata]